MTSITPASGARHEREDVRLRRIAVRHGNRYLVLSTSDIDAVEAWGNYVRIHVGQQVYVLRESLSGLAEGLDPSEFVRVHRSAIVNVDHITEISTNRHGDCTLKTVGGTVVTMSRKHRQELRGRFGPEF